MYKFSVGENTYTVRFTYGSLIKTDLIDRVIKASVPETDDVDGFIGFTKNMLGMTAELLLVGLQKYHADQFGYDTDEERDKRIMELLDLIDDYEDENYSEDEEEKKDGFTLYNDLQRELEKNGFLSKMLAVMATEEQEEQPPVQPQDHKRKARGGQNK